jgi:hypothetical protein
MTVTTTNGSTTSRQDAAPELGVKNKVGLGLCGLLGLFDMTSIALIGRQDTGEPGPPAAVLVSAR